MRMGIDLGEITQLVHVLPLKNKEYCLTGEGNGKLFLTKNWSQMEIVFPPHAIVKDLGVQCPESDQCKSVEEVYKKDSVVFMMNNTYYGSQGTILEPLMKNGRLKSISIHYNVLNFILN